MNILTALVNLVSQAGSLVSQVGQGVSAVTGVSGKVHDVEKEVKRVADAIEGLEGLSPGANDCGCPQMPLPNEPGPLPELPELPELPPNTTDDTNICRSAKALAAQQKALLNGLADLASTGGLTVGNVGAVLASAGIGGAAIGFFKVALAVVGKVFAAAAGIWAGIGWGMGETLRGWADAIPDDVYACAFINNIAVGATPTLDGLADLETAVKAEIDGLDLPLVAKALLKMAVWPDLLMSIVTHVTFDENGAMIAWDLSHIDGSDCWCGDVPEFGFFGDNSSIRGCDDHQFDRWETHDGSPLAISDKIYRKVRCETGDENNHVLAGHSAIVMPATNLAHRGFMTPIAFDSDFTGRVRFVVARSNLSASYGIGLLDSNKSFLSGRTESVGGGYTELFLYLENVPAGTYWVNFRKHSGNGSIMAVRVELLPGEWWP